MEASTSPWRSANMAAAPRVLTPVLVKMCSMWVAAVRDVIDSS